MQTLTTITHISHDDLVNLFSTALYGSNYLGAGYSYSEDLSDCQTLEDALAASLIKGRKIRVTDYYADGVVYGEIEHEIDGDDVTYHITLDDVKKGIAKAADGTFNSRMNEYADDEREFARKAFDSFANESCDFDLTYAECLMQIILFDEIIYG